MKIKLLSAVCISISLLGFISCSNQAPKSAETPKGFEKSIDLNAKMDSIFKIQAKIEASEILETLAEPLIEDFKSYTSGNIPFYIPANWYFDKKHLIDLLYKSGKTIEGLRFYSALNDNSTTNKHLTFVVVPVESIPGQVPPLKDYLGYKLYEFAQTCPKLCKKFSGEIDILKSDLNKDISHSYYFRRESIDSILNVPGVNFLKLGRRVSTSSIMDLTLTGVDAEDKHDELTDTKINLSTPCLPNCPITTAFYHN